MAAATSPKNLRVLISGAGIAGLVAAYWLGKAGFSVTVIERFDEIRRSGHIICVRKVAVPIIKYMGLEENIQSQASLEQGIQILDENNTLWASFPQSDTSFSSGLELDRGELVNILYEASKDSANYILGNCIRNVEEKNNCLQVSLLNGNFGVMEFDILLVSEGLSSRTRAQVFNEDVRRPIQSLDQWAASFSYLSSEHWARWYNSTKHRCLLVRPSRSGRVHVLAMCKGSQEDDKITLCSHKDKEKQRQYFLNLFEDTGRESTKIMKNLSDADDLHVQEMAQVKCKTWSTGRTVLIGDAAYCPSPVGGNGTSAAIVGAYILAAELIKNPTDHQRAFLAYESSMRPWIDDIQKPAPRAIKIGIPATRLGIYCFRLLAYVLSSTLFSSLLFVLTQIRKWKRSPIISNIPIIPLPSVFETCPTSSG